jgi:hypothetical protein
MYVQNNMDPDLDSDQGLGGIGSIMLLQCGRVTLICEDSGPFQNANNPDPWAEYL